MTGWSGAGKPNSPDHLDHTKEIYYEELGPFSNSGGAAFRRRGTPGRRRTGLGRHPLRGREQHQRHAALHQLGQRHPLKRNVNATNCKNMNANRQRIVATKENRYSGSASTVLWFYRNKNFSVIVPSISLCKGVEANGPSSNGDAVSVGPIGTHGLQFLIHNSHCTATADSGKRKSSVIFPPISLCKE